jgi:hypothetical protein
VNATETPEKTLYCIMGDGKNLCKTCGRSFPYWTTTDGDADHKTPDAHKPAVIDTPENYARMTLKPAKEVLSPAEFARAVNIDQRVREIFEDAPYVQTPHKEDV